MIIPLIPRWMQTIVFNYCFEEIVEEFPATVSGDLKTLSTKDYRYVAYNKRHNPVLVLQLYTAQAEKAGTRTAFYEGFLVFNPWSWDEDGSVKENRLGISRPGNYAFQNEMAAEIKISFAAPPGQSNAPAYALTEIEETYYQYDARGRRSTDYIVKRAVGEHAGVTGTGTPPRTLNLPIQFLLFALQGCKINPSNPVYPSATRRWDIGFAIFGTPYYETERRIYTQLSAQAHLIYSEKSGGDGTRVSGYMADAVRVLAPIPRRQRVQALDTGQWAEVSLEESGAAAAARYYGMIYNNAYPNLGNQEDTGVQQMLAAADADFSFAWGNRHGVNFNDIRALQSTLLSYVGVLAAYTCRALGIRHQYADYVAAVITYYESTRGITSKKYGAHTFYPWLGQIEGGYKNFLTSVFELLAVDLSANDSPTVLLAKYTDGIAIYNSWMAGSSFQKGENTARLGDRVAASINSRLQRVQEFHQRYMWASIDRALAAAYLNDASFSGNIEVNDAGVIIKPGDSVRVSFLDSVQDLTVVGIDMSVSPDSLDYSAQVRKQW
jgi:hypothetical protein